MSQSVTSRPLTGAAGVTGTAVTSGRCCTFPGVWSLVVTDSVPVTSAVGNANLHWLAAGEYNPELWDLSHSSAQHLLVRYFTSSSLLLYMHLPFPN